VYIHKYLKTKYHKDIYMSIAVFKSLTRRQSIKKTLPKKKGMLF